MCADRTTGRRVHTRCAAVATHGTDSATDGGAAGGPATGSTRRALIDGPQNPQLVVTIGQSLARQREAGGAQQDQCEPEQGRKFLDASSELEDFLSEFQLGQVRHVQADHRGRRRAEPPPCRRPRNAAISGDGQVPGALNELAQPVVVALLRARRGRHGNDHRPFHHAAQLPRRRRERPPA